MRGQLPPSGWALALWIALFLPLMGGSMAGALASGGDLWSAIADPLATFPTLLAALWGLSAWAAALWIARRRRSPSIRLVVLLFLAFVSVHAAYVYGVRPYLLADYARYWDIATRLARERIPLERFITGPEQAIHRRTLPFYAPLAALCGPSLWVVRVANVLVATAIAALAYGLCALGAGRRVAATALALLIGHPELTFATALPSHELAGGLFFMAALLLLARLLGGGDIPAGRRALLSLLLGLDLYMLQVQRGVGWILLVAIGVSWLAGVLQGGDRSWRRLLHALIIPAVIAVAVFHVSLSLGVFRGDTAGRNWYLAMSTVRSDGTYPAMLHQMKSYLDAVPLRDRSLFVLTRLLFEATEEPLSRPLNMGVRAWSLFRLGSHQVFYGATLAADSPVHDAAFLTSWRAAYGLVLLTAFVLALAKQLGRRPPDAVWIGLVWSALVTGFLLTTGEIQPYYSFTPSLVMVLLAAEWLAGGGWGERVRRPWGRAAAILVVAGLLTLLGLLSLQRALSARIAPLDRPVAVERPPGSPAVEVIRSFPGRAEIRFAGWPGSTVTYAVRYPLPTTPEADRFGVWIETLDHHVSLGTAVEVEVEVGGRRAVVGSLLAGRARYVELPLDPPTRGEALEFTLRIRVRPDPRGPAFMPPVEAAGIAVTYPWTRSTGTAPRLR